MTWFDGYGRLKGRRLRKILITVGSLWKLRQSFRCFKVAELVAAKSEPVRKRFETLPAKCNFLPLSLLRYLDSKWFRAPLGASSVHNLDMD